MASLTDKKFGWKWKCWGQMALEFSGGKKLFLWYFCRISDFELVLMRDKVGIISWIILHKTIRSGTFLCGGKVGCLFFFFLFFSCLFSFPLRRLMLNQNKMYANNIIYIKQFVRALCTVHTHLSLISMCQ